MGSNLLSILLIPLYIILFFLTGSLITCRMSKEKFSVIYTVLTGFFLYFAIFQCVALPFKLLLKPLSMLSTVWMLILLVLIMVSLIWNKNQWLRMLRSRKTTMSAYISLLLAAGILLQVVIIVNNIQYGSYADASYYIGDSVRSVATNTIEQYEQYTGVKRSQLPSIYVLLTYTAHNSVLSYVTGFHPLVIWRELSGSLVIILGNLVVFQTAKTLLKKEWQALGVWGVWFFTLFFTYSAYSPSGFFFYRAFEGKTILAVIVIPYFILQMIRSIKSEFKKSNFMITVLGCIGSLSFTMSSLILLPVLISLFYLPGILAFRKRSVIIQYVILMGICLAELLCYLLFSMDIWKVLIG